MTRKSAGQMETPKNQSQPKGKRGRPSLKILPNFRTRCWFNAASQASGLNAAALDLEFCNSLPRPCIWEKYRSGKITPSMPKLVPLTPEQQKNIVHRVETKHPGTRKWLELPLWTLLDTNQQAFPENFYEIMYGLDPEVGRLILYAPDAHRSWFLNSDVTYEFPRVIAKLVEIRTVDAATALYALSMIAVAGQNFHLYRKAVNGFTYILDKLKDGPAIIPLASEIRSFVMDQNPFKADVADIRQMDLLMELKPLDDDID